MTKRILIATAIVLMVITTTPLMAQDPDGPALTLTDGLTQAQIAAGNPNDAAFIKLMRTLGLVVFTTPFNTYDGLGDGPFDPLELPTTMPGHRPTLQGNGVFLRINGLDAQSCNECHSIVSNATLPPEQGIGGAGGVAQNAIPAATLVDISDSFDDRVTYVPGHDPDLPLVHDGVADFNGRFINPPFLFGGGGVELLAREMTYDLQKYLNQAQAATAGTVFVLNTHGVNFGTITSLGFGSVRLDLDGISTLDGPTVFTPADKPEVHLVVRPFGRKGEAFSMRDFDRNAMQFHFGMQPVEVPTVGSIDEDRDGLANELTVAEMSVLHIFSVTNPRPYQDNTSADDVGSEYFKEIGCNSCHINEISTYSSHLPLSHPEVAEDPTLNVFWRINLRKFGFDPVSNGFGIRVPLFSDLKRHDMGPGLAESCEACEVSDRELITARLWGIADSAPYLHDGRATTLYQAIEQHGGDALPARNAFLALSQSQQASLIKFLKTLRTPQDPNTDILP